MSTSDPLIAEFERLLDGIPDTFTLQQWQFAYKKVIFTMGLKILNKFPQDAFGPQPPWPLWYAPESEGHADGAPGPMPSRPPFRGRGPNPAGGGPTGNPIIHVWYAAMELTPPPPP